MTRKEITEEIFKPAEAKITAETDLDGNTKIKVEGRGLEVLTLSIAIAEQTILNSNGVISVNGYCNILKDVVNGRGKSKEQQDVEHEILKQLFERVFK